jgi:hypothetical protein
MLGKFDIAKDWAAGMTPFLFSRAEGVLFPGLDILDRVPIDEEIQSEVGPYTDSSYLALRIYVNKCSDPEERESRKMKAFSYAIEKLSTRFTKEQAHRYWLSICRSAGFPVESEFADLTDASTYPYPVLPTVLDAKETIEWDPVNNFHAPPVVKARPLEVI